MGRIVDYNLTEELEHGIFVSCLVRDLARELNLDEPVVYRLTLASPIICTGPRKSSVRLSSRK